MVEKIFIIVTPADDGCLCLRRREMLHGRVACMIFNGKSSLSVEYTHLPSMKSVIRASYLGVRYFYIFESLKMKVSKKINHSIKNTYEKQCFRSFFHY